MQSRRGMVRIVWPAASSDQLAANCSSLAEASVARAAVTFLSKSARSWLRDAAGSSLYGGSPGGATSKESCCMVSTAHSCIRARCVASAPMLNDLGCGFQPNLSSGQRSNTFRVLAISRSNSGSRLSEIINNLLEYIRLSFAQCQERNL